MTDEKELRQLIQDIRDRGAIVTVTLDEAARLQEGRELIDSVQIEGVKGIGPHPMSPVAAAEAMREALATLPVFRLDVTGSAWSEESAEQGGVDREWVEMEDAEASEEDLAVVLRKYGVHAQLDPGSGILAWTVTSNEWDRECFEEGLTKSFSLLVREPDGSLLSEVNRRRAQRVFDMVRGRPGAAPAASSDLSL